MATYEFVLMIAPVLLVWYFAIRRGKKPSEPTTWPVLGMLPAVLLNLHRVHDYATEVLTECGGTYRVVGPRMDMLFTSAPACDPANIHHVFSRNFSNYSKGPEFHKIFDIFSDDIFRAYFELWEIHRKTTLAQLMHGDFNANLQRNVWHKVDTGLFPVLDHFSGARTDLDLQDIFQRLAFDNICKFVLDYDPCSLRPDLPFLPCEKAFSAVMEALLHRHVFPEWMWKLQKWLNVSDERNLAKAAVAFDDFIYPRIISGVNVLKAFEKVYRERNMASSNGSLRDFLKDTSLNLMFAGRDLTSTCLTWLFWLVSQNPASETKILEEMEAELRLKEDKKFRFFSAQESHKLVEMYLHGALCESLRLFPPVALEHKAPVRPDILSSGHHLHGDKKLIISFYSVGRMESVWGKDYLEFKPERWISPSGKIKYEPSYKFPAFSAGRPRTCLGKEMAFVQMKTVAAAILYRYMVRLVEGHRVSPRVLITLQARDGLKVLLSKRNWI
ncbi:noroxomaritidine synthase-like [Salvia miltiorrhiza]|uniref:noroxomaritidine synthase-like n=1 Tax=Salvia miltiorrhiza TaxID=226208 RepID=UPI0025ABACF7|nr:noroxomaritidine synthase-like [Salvia miltiorrhiza]